MREISDHTHCLRDELMQTKVVSEAIAARIEAHYKDVTATQIRCYPIYKSECLVLQQQIKQMFKQYADCLPPDYQKINITNIEDCIDVYAEHQYLITIVNRLRLWFSIRDTHIAVKSGVTNEQVSAKRKLSIVKVGAQ